jgi:hypothetical protein
MYFRSSPADSRIQTCGQDCRDQKSAVTANWETVMACLAELGFHAQGDRPPAAAEVVLAAQLRLRYWRRQLPCGRLGITDEPDMSGDFVGVRAGDLPAGRRGGDAGAASQPIAAREAAASAEAFVRRRIRSIKSARDCLLACNREGLTAATAER